MNIYFLADGPTLNFLGEGEPGVFHIEDCDFVSGTYRLIHVLSTVTIRRKKRSPSLWKRLRNWLQHCTLSTFCSSVNILGIYLAHRRLILSSSWITRCTVSMLQSDLSCILRIVIRRSLSSSPFITATWFDVTLGRPLRLSLWMLWPPRNRAYHLYIVVFFIAWSPYVFCNLNIVSFFLWKPVQNTNFYWRSLFRCHFNAYALNNMAA
jgi:hypothetical protein